MVNTSGYRIFTTFNYLFFVLISLIMLYPFWYVVMYSFSDPQVSAINHLYLWPKGFSLSSYERVFESRFIYYGLFNSLIITTVGTTINLLLTSTTAYAISRSKLVFRNLFFSIVIFTMIFQGGLIPTYLVVRSFGLIDTLWALMIPQAINIFNLLIMMKFFKNLPEEMIEAAHIDGCNDMGVYWRIVVKLSTPVFAAIGLFYAVQHWNEFFQGMLYLNDRDKWPLQVVVIDMIRQSDSDLELLEAVEVSPVSFKMATVVVTALPIILVYPFLQKYFVKGIMLGSVKG